LSGIKRTGRLHVVRHPTLEEAIEDTCKLIDGGYEVVGLGTGSLSNSITKDDIAKISDLWERIKSPSSVFDAAT
jgi:hypothetical protein